MKNIAGLLSMAVVYLVLANCQAPLVSNQTASLRFSVTSPIAVATNNIATRGTSARLLDSTTNQIQLQINDQTGAIVYQKTIPRNSQDIYQFSGLPNGIGFSVTLNALYGTTVLTTGTRRNVDLWAGKVNSVSLCLAPPNPSLPSANIPIPINSSTGQINFDLTAAKYASVKFITSTSSNESKYRFYAAYGRGATSSQCSIIAINANGEILTTTHSINPIDEWYINGCPANSEITIIIFPIENVANPPNNCYIFNEQ